MPMVIIKKNPSTKCLCESVFAYVKATAAPSRYVKLSDLKPSKHNAGREGFYCK